MPRRIDPPARGQQVYHAVRELGREGGIEAVTVRAVAARAELACSSLRQQYRDKDFLLRCVIHECALRFNRASYPFRPTGQPVDDVVGLLATQLPRDEDEHANALLWLVLLVAAALAAACDPVQELDRDRVIEMLRLHAHHLQRQADP